MTKTLDQLFPENGFIVNVLRSQTRRSLRHGLDTLPNADEVLKTVANTLGELGNKRESDITTYTRQPIPSSKE